MLIQVLFVKRARLDIIRKKVLRLAIRAMLEHILIEMELRTVLAVLRARFLSQLVQILLPRVSNAHWEVSLRIQVHQSAPYVREDRLHQRQDCRAVYHVP